jgi:hypothetical protein
VNNTGSWEPLVIYCVKRYFQQYSSYIMATSFSGLYEQLPFI